MFTKYSPEPRDIDAPVERRRTHIPSALADACLFPGWGPRI